MKPEATPEPMRLALDLARRGLGRTHPNPPVGAVIVRAGRVVGRGFHPRAGEPHAEVFALREAGDAARGAVMYVTLEPCVHHGRTPPCVDAILEAGIAEVHIAMLDPNPVVHGKGVAKLRAAGVKVVLGEGAAEARRLTEGFAHWIRTQRPWVVAKYAMTLDGKVATRTGQARWITGPEARTWVHRLRDGVDAILVGRGTVEADDPRLTTRLPDLAAPHHPLRVILDSRGRAPLTARLFDPALPGRTVVATTPAMPAARRQALQARGVAVWPLPPGPDGRVSLPALLDALGREGMTTLLVEGGPTVLGAFFDAGLVHKVHAFIAPVLVGGARAPSPIAGLGRPHMAQAPRLQQVTLERLGPDLLLTGYLVLPTAPDAATAGTPRAAGRERHPA